MTHLRASEPPQPPPLWPYLETGDLNSGQTVFAMFPLITYPVQSCPWTCGFSGCFFLWQLLYRSLKANLITSVVNLVTNQISRQKQYRREIYKPYATHTYTYTRTHSHATNPKTNHSSFSISWKRNNKTLQHNGTLYVNEKNNEVSYRGICLFFPFNFNKLLNRRSNLT